MANTALQNLLNDMSNQKRKTNNLQDKKYLEDALVVILNALKDTTGGAAQVVAAGTTVGANTGTSAAGLTLIGATDTTNQAANIMNDLVALQEDIAAIRAALVAVGIIA